MRQPRTPTTPRAIDRPRITVTIPLDETTAAQLVQLARRYGTSKAAVVRQLIKDEVQRC